MQKPRIPSLVGHAFAVLAFAGILAIGAVGPAEAKGLGAAGAVFTMTNSTDGNAVLAFARSGAGELAFADAYDTGGTGTGAGLGNQGGLALDASGNHLFVVNAGSDSLSVFAAGPKGLSLLDVESSGGAQPISVTVHGDLIYVLNAGGDGNISGLRLDADGTLAPIAGSTRPLSGSGTAPAQIAFSPDGRVLVVSEKGTNTLVTYVVRDDGLPSDPIVTAAEGETPFGFSFGHRGRLLVSEAFGGAFEASAVSSYELGRDGSLEPFFNDTATTETAACWLVVTGDGRYGYTTNTGSDSITGLALARDGSVSLLDADGFTAQAGDAPIDAAFSRNSRFLYVLNAADGTLSAYRLQADGGLAELAGVGGLPAGTNGLAAK
jgi:6-phosphogluconolactonase (cycloisomerase 2 family)